MGFLSWLCLKPPDPPTPQNSWLLTNTEFFASPTSSGKTVTGRTAMQMTAFYACVRILAEAVASLPLHLYQQRDGTTGGNERATTHPLYWVLHDEPKAEMTSFVFRETLVTHLLPWGGNAYAQVIRNERGEVIGLYPLLPFQMVVDRDPDTGLLRYTYRSQTTDKPPMVVLSLAGVLHILGLGFDGWWVTARFR